ncbi:MAG TPA: Zn-dependent hydrolase, partial [Trueperaceae bacterium]
QQNERAPFPLEVVAFGDEEGVRFQAGLLGSRALTGTLPPDVLHLTDEAGITLAQALHDFGLDPNQLHRAARPASDILAYLEIHIEQGPVLETHDLPVGVVTGISGASRYKIDIHGQSGHAGTVPMQLRHDALTAAADVILALESLCRNRDDLVGTIGQIHAEPGAVNVIPGHATLTADLRAPQDQTRRQAAREFEAAISRITHQRGTPTILRQTYEVASTQCDPSLSRQLAHAIRAQGIHPHSLPSGAGHDAMAMAHLTDVAMLFVRCAGGVSHHPAEAVDPSDVTTVSNVVLHFIRALQRPARA